MTAKNYDIIKSVDTLKAFTDKLLLDAKPIGFDIETGYYGPNREKGALFVDWDEQFTVGFSLTNDPSMARYVALGHDYGSNLPEQEVWELMKPVLETLPVIAHNMKYEKRNLRALERKGRGPSIDINVFGDTALQSYVLSGYPGHDGSLVGQRHNLKEVVKNVFNHEMATLKSLFPDVKEKDLKALRFNTLDTSNPEVVSYACEDAAWCLALHDFFAKLIPERQFMYDLELRIMSCLCDMEDAGHAVDWDGLEEQEAIGYPFHEQMVDATRKGLSQMSGQDESALNLNSNKQMAEVLYERIGLSTSVMTKGGKTSGPKMSTNAIALEGLSREHPAVKKILESREVLNLANRLKKWKTEYSQTHDKRVHPSFNQVVGDGFGSEGGAVGSGRFSANDPSIQQLPKDWRWSTFLGVDPYHKEYWAKINEVGTFGKHYWNGNFRDFLTAAHVGDMKWDHNLGKLRKIEKPEDGCYLLGFDYCVAPETRVLTSDLRWIQAGDVAEGDELIGFDEIPGRSSKLRRSRVEKTKRVMRDGYRVTLDDGSVLIASGDHLWVSTGGTSRDEISDTYIPKAKRKWVRTRNLVPGESTISKWIEPWNLLEGQDAVDAAWLGGVLDGEGWIMDNCVGFGQVEGAVLQKFRDVTSRLSLDVGAEYAYEKSRVVRTYFRGNQNSLKALAVGGSVRLLPRAHEMWEGKQSYGRGRMPIVVSVELLGEIETVALQTSTRTFIAEGFLSHNSQIELRCMAGMSQEQSLLEAFNNDEDVHTLTAAMMLKKPVEDIDPDRDRPVGKTMNFALLYGMGEKSLSERLAMPLWEAEALYVQYFEAFTRVTEWMNEMKAFGWTHHYIETHFGRKWTIWESMSHNRVMLSKAERMFVNGPVQGTAADYMKIAMLRAKATLEKKGWWMTHVRMINNLHDALTFEVDNSIDPNELRAVLAEAVVWRNDSIADFPKIVADWELGQRWGSAAKWKAGEAFLENGIWRLPEPVKKPEPVEEETMSAPKAVTVEIEVMPNKDEFDRFLVMLKNNPGDCVVTLKTPQGETGLAKYPTDSYSVNKYASVILSSATVRIP